ncbi:MAG: M61 family metallopeptidase [Gammaproteobacteria bacterium]|nr:M61 family metallopeptidase [Gammaproteobacteria bacterium]
MICYEVELKSPEAHLFQVVLEIPTPDPEGQIISLPAWIPGSYMIRDFARNIVTLSASTGGQPARVKRLDKQSWQIEPCRGSLQITYDVYAWDLSVRGAYLDTTRGFITGTSLFLRVVGQDRMPIKVEFRRPGGEHYRDWRLATTLAGEETAFLEFGCYRAENYDELIDHPVEMGLFSHAQFQVREVPHDIVISGRHSADLARLCDDLKAICEHHVSFFGELPNMDRFLFQVAAVGDGYGGLEHRSSTSLLCKRSDLPQQNEKIVSDGYRQFLGLCSHEYFHLWHVKRIRPEVLREADLSKEIHTTLLWAFEGITSYYDDLALVRSGRIDQESYLELLAKQMTRLMRGTGRLKQTLAESSFDAWTKFYKQDENASNAIVSYYNKGALLSLVLDLLMRRETEGRVSLDDVMRELWAKYGKTDIGLQEGDIEKIACDLSGIDLNVFFERYLNRTDELPLREMLDNVGVGLDYFPAHDRSDRGGLLKDRKESKSTALVLGAQFVADNRDIRLTTVYDNGAAQKAGLSAGDVIVAVDAIRVDADQLEKRIANAARGKLIRIHAFRRDELMVFDLQPEPAPGDTCRIWIKTEEQEAANRRNQWLMPDS